MTPQTRTKVVPPPRPRSFLREAARTMPLVPGTVDDCCARLMADTGLPSQDVAREWITFMAALGLAAEADAGYYGTRDDPDDDALRQRFRERVFLADEVVEVVEETWDPGASGEPVTATTVFERVAERVPRWERSRHTDWRAVWLDHTQRRLDWAVELGLLTAADGGYRPADASN